MAQEIALVTNPMRVPLVMSRIGWLVLAMDIRVWRRNGGMSGGGQYSQESEDK